MYDVDGDFGRVKFFNMMSVPAQPDGLFFFKSGGWHCCNEKYKIIRPEGIDEHLILITIKGNGGLKIGKNDYILRSSSVALVPRNTETAYFTMPGSLWEFYWIHPCGKTSRLFLDSLASLASLGKYCAYDADIDGFMAVIDGITKLCGDKPDNFWWRLSGLVGELLHLTAYALSENGENQNRGVCEQAIAIIEREYAYPLDLKSLGEQLYVSPEHLIRKFKEKTGCTPHEYLNRFRIFRAEQLLSYTSDSIRDIAEKTGFCSASHLISRFRQSNGMTPTKFRAKTQPEIQNRADGSLTV